MTKKLFISIICTFFLVSLATNISAYNLTEGLKTVYDFDQTSGQLIDQVGGNDSISVSSNVIQTATGINGNAYWFRANASDNSFMIPIPTDVLNGSDAFTVTCWVKPNPSSANIYHIFLSGYAVDGYTEMRMDDDRTIYGEIGDGDTHIFTIEDDVTMVEDGETWQLIALSYNKSAARGYMFVNGTYRAYTEPTGLIKSDNRLQLGRKGSGGLTYILNGTMDECYFWDRNLTISEHEALYNNGTGLFFPFNFDPPLNSSWNVTSENIASGENISVWNVGGTINVTSNLLTGTFTANVNSNWSCRLDVEQNHTEMIAANSNYKLATTETKSHSFLLYDNITEGNHCLYCSGITKNGFETAGGVSSSGCLNVTLVQSPNVTLDGPLNGSTKYSIDSIVFNFSVEYGTYDVSNCSLYGNFSGSWELNATLINETCYQETVNVSTSCGGLDTGNYSFTGGTFDNNEASFYDGDWNTFASCLSDVCYVYSNYSKPTGSLSSSKWRIRSCNNVAQNLSIPLLCWNQVNLQFKSAISNPSSTVNWSCYNGTDWQHLVYHGDGECAYEEAMYWDFNIRNNTITDFSPLNLLDGDYKWNVQCYDTNGQNDWGDSNYSLSIATLPLNPAMYINNTEAWNYSGSFEGPEQVENFEDELNASLQDCTSVNGSCDIPMNFSSEGEGILNIYNIDIQYTIVDTYLPVINSITATPSPAQVQDTLTIKVNATDNVNISKVNVSIEGSASDLTYNTTSRLYEGTLIAPPTAKIYTITAIAVDAANLTTTSTEEIIVNSTNAELIVYADYIIFNNTEPEENDSVEINATIFNEGGVDANNFDVELLIDNNSIANNTISVSSNSNTTTSFNWDSTEGNHSIMVKADTNGIITEDNETNNNATKYLLVLDITPPAINEIITNDVSEGENLIIKVNATDNAGISQITALINGTSLILTYNTTSNLYENSTTSVLVGIHILEITATDVNNLVSTKKTSVTVNNVNADLILAPEDVSFSQQVLGEGESITIYANISNDGGTNANNFNVELLIDDVSQENNSLSVPANSKNLTQFTWTAANANHTLTFKVDSLNNISESNETNNEINKTISVVDTTPPSINEVIVPDSVYEGSNLPIKVNATDNINISKVNVTISGTEIILSYNTTSSLYENTTTAPTAGTYNITITAIDVNDLKASKKEVIEVYEGEADLTLDYTDLTLNPIASNITENITLTINVTVHNNGGTDANNFKVELLVDDVSQQNNTLSVAKASNISTTFTWNTTYGSHNLTIKLDVDNDIGESNESNNDINKTIFVLDATPPPALNLAATPSNWTNQTTFNVSWTAVTDTNGIDRYEYQIDYGEFTSVELNTSFITPTQSQGVHTVYVRAVDNPGNEGDLDNESVYVDDTSPNTPVIREWHCGDNWTQHNSPYLSWTDPGDEGSGIVNYNISIDDTTFIDNDANLSYHSSTLKL